MIELVCAIALQLATFWLTGGLMVIGFAIMVGGWHGAGAAVAFCFTRPLRSLAHLIGEGIAQTVVAFGQLIGSTIRALFTDVIDPLLMVCGKVLRVVLFPRRR